MKIRRQVDESVNPAALFPWRRPQLARDERARSGPGRVTGDRVPPLRLLLRTEISSAVSAPAGGRDRSVAHRDQTASVNLRTHSAGHYRHFNLNSTHRSAQYNPKRGDHRCLAKMTNAIRMRHVTGRENTAESAEWREARPGRGPEGGGGRRRRAARRGRGRASRRRNRAPRYCFCTSGPSGSAHLIDHTLILQS